MAYLLLSGIDKDTPERIDSRQRDVAAEQAPALLPATKATEPSPPLPEPTVVAIDQHSIRHPIAVTLPSIPRDRGAVARQLQKELKRIGCYMGHVDGEWTASTRRAMQAFTDRVNAKLPADQPDIVLLALVQAQPDKVCGAPCPAGQDFSHTGQCLPKPILARSNGAQFAARPNASPAPSIAWTMATASPALHPSTDPDGTLVSPTPRATRVPAPKRQLHHLAEWRSQRPVRQEGSWAHNLFAQQNRYGR
jgi:hypothetical protein